MNINRVMLLGTLAHDPSVTFTEKGSQSALCSLLVQETGSDGQTYKLFVPLVAYGHSAATLGDCSQGDTVLIEGRLMWHKQAKDSDRPAGLAVFVQNVEAERVPNMAAVSEN
jgi:single-stranded DNA-binding protein